MTFSSGQWIRLAKIFIRDHLQYQQNEKCENGGSLLPPHTHRDNIQLLSNVHNITIVPSARSHTWTDCSLFFRKKQSNSDKRAALAAVSPSSWCYLMLQLRLSKLTILSCLSFISKMQKCLINIKNTHSYRYKFWLHRKPFLSFLLMYNCDINLASDHTFL